MSGNATYGFVLFFNLLSAINAKKAMDGAQLGRNRIRVRLICACACKPPILLLMLVLVPLIVGFLSWITKKSIFLI